MTDTQKEDKATPRPWGSVTMYASYRADGYDLFTLMDPDTGLMIAKFVKRSDRDICQEAVNNYDALKKKAEALDALVEAVFESRIGNDPCWCRDLERHSHEPDCVAISAAYKLAKEAL